MDTIKARLAARHGMAYAGVMHNATFSVHIQYCSDAAHELYEAQGGLTYATALSAGLDLRACLAPESGDELVIPAGARALVPSGIAVQPGLPHVAGFIYSRSGLGAREGLTVAQGVGVVDADYRGEILVMLLNTSSEERRLRRGERMAQLVFQPILRADIAVVDALDSTERGAGGFGHTGTV